MLRYGSGSDTDSSLLNHFKLLLHVISEQFTENISNDFLKKNFTLSNKIFNDIFSHLI